MEFSGKGAVKLAWLRPSHMEYHMRDLTTHI